MESIISLSLSLARSLVKMMMTTQCPLEATYHFFFLSFISVLGCLTRAGALLKGTSTALVPLDQALTLCHHWAAFRNPQPPLWKPEFKKRS